MWAKMNACFLFLFFFFSRPEEQSLLLLQLMPFPLSFPPPFSLKHIHSQTLSHPHARANIYSDTPKKSTHIFLQTVRAHTRTSASAHVLSHRQTQTFTRVGQESSNHGPVTPRRFPEYAFYIFTEPISEHRQTCQHLSLLAGFHLHDNKHGR